MPTVNIHAAKTHLSRLIDEAAAGTEIIIARAGTPIARLVPLHGEKPKRVLGLMAGRISASADFDAPLPDNILQTFEPR